ncbi:CoA pyrophosphatase [Paremcibacter congregatus]|uniref:CoA pyrophosphatase n=1 Tax=Paremcibacter congregatus TaxID=2043170 RepID=UPI0030EC5AF6
MKQRIRDIFRQYDPGLERARQTVADKRDGDRPRDGDWNIYRPAADYKSSEQPLRPAAVLIPLVDRKEGLTVLLTKRAAHLKTHSGQVSFPGGRCDQEDAHAMDTALRETQEEVGIDRSHIEVLGAMEDYETMTGFLITPVVGIIAPEFKLIVAEEEVDEAFELPLDYILDEANHDLRDGIWKERKRYYYALINEQHNVWGATAAMLVRFAHLVNGGVK